MKLTVDITKEVGDRIEYLKRGIDITTKCNFFSSKKEDRDAFEREFKSIMHPYVMKFLSGDLDFALRGFGCKKGRKCMEYFDTGCRAIFRYCLKDGVCDEEFILNAFVIKEQEGDCL